MRSEIVIDFLRPGGMANALCPPFFCMQKGPPTMSGPSWQLG